MATLQCIGSCTPMSTASRTGTIPEPASPDLFSRSASNLRRSTLLTKWVSVKSCRHNIGERFGRRILRITCEASPSHASRSTIGIQTDRCPINSASSHVQDITEVHRTPFGPDDTGDISAGLQYPGQVSHHHHVQEKRKAKAVEVPKRRRSSRKPRVILIAGPTAVGKTRLSIELAKALGGEIINADSVQVYQGLDVGAAKATMEERQGILHHLMDVVPPTVEYTYPQFLVDARAATEHILAKGLVPIVIGGTGMYMRWYMHNLPDITSHPFRGEAEFIAGEPESDHWDYEFQAYFLYQHRADLYPRVDVRCEQMVPKLLEETSWLLDLGVEPQSNSAAKAIGYDEAMELLLEARQAHGVVTPERLLRFLTLFQKNSKALVRKQIAWFRDDTRSDVRRFRWLQAGGPVEEMVEALVGEYHRRPRVIGRAVGNSQTAPLVWRHEELRMESTKEQKRIKGYKPLLAVYNDPEAVARTLAWIKATQSHYNQQLFDMSKWCL